MIGQCCSQGYVLQLEQSKHTDKLRFVGHDNIAGKLNKLSAIGQKLFFTAQGLSVLLFLFPTTADVLRKDFSSTYKHHFASATVIWVSF